jgi:hypothetical protein
VEMTILETAARAAGVLPSAVEDAVRRLAGHFSAMADPSPAMISAQLAALKESAPHLFPRGNQLDAAGVPGGIPPEVWKSLSPATKLSWAREHQPLAPGGTATPAAAPHERASRHVGTAEA